MSHAIVLTEELQAALIERVILHLSELPDRNSPEDDPEALIASPKEISGTISSVLETIAERQCRACHREANPIMLCDEDAGDGARCSECFEQATHCARDHGEGCATAVFWSEPPSSGDA